MCQKVIHSSKKNFKPLLKEFYAGQTYVAFDTETSGFSYKKNFIIELSAVKFNCDGIIGEPFSTLINHDEKISPFITELTGITDEMLSEGIDEYEAVKKFISFIGTDSILVAHNAPFDIHFINAVLERNRLPDLKNRFVDTLVLCRAKFPQLKEEEKGSYRLENLARRFHFDNGKNHRALSDSFMCMELFKILAKDAC